MSHRQEEKRAARAAREAAEARELARAMRRRRVIALAVAAAVAVVAVVVGVAISTGSGSGDGAGKGGAVAGVADSRAMLGGIEQKGPRLGDPAAPVVLTEYADLQCPYCREYAVNVLPRIIEDYVRAGKVQLELRLLRFVGADSNRAAHAAYAASERDRMWDFVDLFYRNQGTENTGYADDEFLTALGSAAKVPGTLAAVNGSAHEGVLTRVEAEAQAAGISSTPTFLLGRTAGAGRRVEGMTYDTLAKAIDAQLTG